MTTTPEDALQAARTYVTLNIIGHQATDRIYEDETDYFIETESKDPELDGPGFLFVSKATGKAYTLAPMAGLNKAHEATPVDL